MTDIVDIFTWFNDSMDVYPGLGVRIDEETYGIHNMILGSNYLTFRFGGGYLTVDSLSKKARFDTNSNPEISTCGFFPIDVISLSMFIEDPSMLTLACAGSMLYGRIDENAFSDMANKASPYSGVSTTIGDGYVTVSSLTRKALIHSSTDSMGLYINKNDDMPYHIRNYNPFGMVVWLKHEVIR